MKTKSNVGNIQSTNLQEAAQSTGALGALNYRNWRNFDIPTNSGIAASGFDWNHDGGVFGSLSRALYTQARWE